MFTIEMLSAAHGDALLVEYGDGGCVHRLLVDGGPWAAYEKGLRSRIALIPEGRRRFELMVITHVDTDHIDGIIRLLHDPSLKVEFGDIWFNGWNHLQQARGKLGGAQGEFLEALLEQNSLPWNRHFAGNCIVVGLPSIHLEGGMKVTILSPEESALGKLEKQWVDALRKEGFSPGDRNKALAQLARRAEYGPPTGELGTGPDSSAANASSIAMLLEFEGKTALLAADAFEGTLMASLRQRVGAGLLLDAFKLSHHGSFGNISPALVQFAPARRYLISTNGARFKHPDKDTLELILAMKGESEPELVFNYLNNFTDRWNDSGDQSRRGYSSAYYFRGEPIVL